MDDIFEKLETAATSMGFLIVELFDSAAISAESVIRFLVGCLVTGGRLGVAEEQATVLALLERELLGSTALVNGLAIPHASVPGVNQVEGVLARSSVAIPWASLDGEPVRRIILLLSPKGRRGDSLRTLEQLHKATHQEG